MGVIGCESVVDSASRSDCEVNHKYSGTEIKIDGEEFIIMKEDEVLGILTGAAAPSKKELAGSKK